MGWYHHAIATGENPFEDDEAPACPIPAASTASSDLSNNTPSTEANGGEGTGATTTTTTIPEGGASNDATNNHNNSGEAAATIPQSDTTSGVIYHMGQKKLWEEAVKKKRAYYPPTFVESGRITRACVNPDHLIHIANFAYRTHPDMKWVCIELDAGVLRDRLGIQTTYEPCDEKGGVGESCRQLHGGIPTSSSEKVVKRVYSMKRDKKDGAFLYISGLTKK